jgi:hypothetical protein
VTDLTHSARDFAIDPALDPCQDADTLVSKAKRCRRLAAGISDRQTSDILLTMARNYEHAAARLKDPS